MFVHVTRLSDLALNYLHDVVSFDGLLQAHRLCPSPSQQSIVAGCGHASLQQPCVLDISWDAIVTSRHRKVVLECWAALRSLCDRSGIRTPYKE